MSDDELAPYHDSPVLSALRAPATEDELSGQTAALAMFRAARPSARSRRHVRRAAVGTAGIVLGLAMTGGVAAAYSSALPDPVQNAFNAAIAPFPVPAPPRAHPHRARLRHLLTQRPQVVVPTPHRSPAAIPTSPGVAPQPSRPTAAAPRPSSAPAASPAPAPPPPSLTASVSRHVVPVHGSVALSGLLSRGGEGLAGRQVYAAELAAGTSTWRRVAEGRTGSDGRISLTVPALTANARLRLVTAHATSSPVTVAVVPKVSVQLARSGAQRIATVTADGGRTGDPVVLQRRDGDHWTQIATDSLDAHFTVPGPRSAPVRYRVRLAATRQHAASYAVFTIPGRS